MVMTVEIDKQHNINNEDIKWEKALKRANSYKTRFSTIQSKVFWSSWDNKYRQGNNNRNNNNVVGNANMINDSNNACWKDLPNQIVQLKDNYLQEKSKHALYDPKLLRISIFSNNNKKYLINGIILLLIESLKNRQRVWDDNNDDNDNDDDDVSNMELDDDTNDNENENEPSLSNKYDESLLFSSLRILGWIEGKKQDQQQQYHTDHNIIPININECLEQFIYKEIYKKISSEFEDENILHDVLLWKDNVIIPWIYDVFIGDDNDNTTNATKMEEDNDGIDRNSTYKKNILVNQYNKWIHKIDSITFKCFCMVRIKEIFDIVTDYPDSLQAVNELKYSLEKNKDINLYNNVAYELRCMLGKRLIHPGANTLQIIEVYINVIKVLRIIDPTTDSLLDIVAYPVRSYLRNRNDTVRCIISSLTDEEAGGDLYEELRRQDANLLENEQQDSDDEDEASPPDLNWQPKSKYLTISNNNNNAQQQQQSCILSMLVSIYGSRELFVNEYRVMLGDKLLENLTFNTDKEVHNLELLKLRFGDNSLRHCEVMIKDIDDSKRINSNIHSTIQNNNSNQRRNNNTTRRKQRQHHQQQTQNVVDAAIVSHIFWPTLQGDSLKVHPRIQEQLDVFSVEYAKIKNPRRLIWLNQVGAVQLELEVEEKDNNGNVLYTHSKEFNCSPVHATLIHHFEDKYRWTALDLSNETGLSEAIIRKKMLFWVNNGIVKSFTFGNEDTEYELASSSGSTDGNTNDNNNIGNIEEDDDNYSDAYAMRAQQESEEMQVYDSYVLGMLANLGQLPIERIHNMLKMFASGSDHGYDKSIHQLSTLLQRLCNEDKIEYVGNGLYKLIKKAA